MQFCYFVPSLRVIKIDWLTKEAASQYFTVELVNLQLAAWNSLSYNCEVDPPNFWALLSEVQKLNCLTLLIINDSDNDNSIDMRNKRAQNKSNTDWNYKLSNMNSD